MLIAVLAGLMMSCLLIPLGKYFKTKWGALIATLPFILFCYFAGQLPAIQEGQIIYDSTKWVPSLAINFDFRLDGLSLLFSLLITGIGTLIFLYASSYLK